MRCDFVATVAAAVNLSLGMRLRMMPTEKEPDMPKKPDLSPAQLDRVIQMAWEDRTTFDAIREQFGLQPGEVIKLMRANLKPGSFKLWRKRTAGRDTKHLSKRGFVVGRFRCPSQRG